MISSHGIDIGNLLCEQNGPVTPKSALASSASMSADQKSMDLDFDLDLIDGTSSSSSSKDNSFEADEIKRFGEITKPFSNLKTNNSASTSVAASMAKESSNISSLSSGHCHFKGPTGGTQMSISKKYKKCEC